MKHEGVIAVLYCLLVWVVKMLFVECRFRLSGGSIDDSCLLLVVGSADCCLMVSQSVVVVGSCIVVE
jgi:hypothetical protein